MTTPLIELTDVSVHTKDGTCLVEPINLSINQGKNLTILGETGSGKSLLAQAIKGALPKGLSVQGKIIINGEVFCDDKTPYHHTRFSKLWGKTLAMLPQEPVRSLDPTMKAVNQIAESLQFITHLNKADAHTKANNALNQLGLSYAKDYYPHELSGGMAQRVSFLSATIGGANIVIADEPTKGLDHTNKLLVADLLGQVAKAGGCLLTITHDIDIAHRLSREGDYLMVMKKGELLEKGLAKTVLTAPQSTYAHALMNASPRHWQQTPKTQKNTPLLTLEDIAITRGKKVLFDGRN